MYKTISRQTRKKIDPELYDLYNTLLSDSEDSDIIDKKLNLLKKAMVDFTSELEIFYGLLRHYKLPVDEDMIKFAYDLKYLQISSYKSVRDSNYYILIMQTCVLFRDLYKRYDEICGNDEMFVKIFAFSEFDFKSIFTHVDDRRITDELLRHVDKLHDICNIFVDEAFDPPISIDKMSHAIMTALSVLRKRFQRCDRAFDLLQRSAEKLKDNYSTYYKESIQCGNPMMILQSFVTDIANDPDISSRRNQLLVQMQFKKILNYLKDNYLQHAQHLNPNASKLLNLALNQL